MFVFFALRANKPKLKRVDRYIATSAYQKDVFSTSLGLNQDDIVVVPNGIDLSRFYPGVSRKSFVETQCTSFRKDYHEHMIVHVGRLSADKIDAPVAILSAARTIVSEFPDAVIWIVGSGEYYHHLDLLAKKINEDLQKRVIVIAGAVADACMPVVMDQAEVVIGVGRVAYEAMACGKAVVVAGTSRGPFGGNYGGVVTPSNVAELEAHNFSGRNARDVTNREKIADDCIRLLCDKEYRLDLGRFGRSYVEREHNVENVAARIEDVYREVLGKEARLAK
jgi:glycosyltransferase involved in cell wall biosynthesis